MFSPHCASSMASCTHLTRISPLLASDLNSVKRCYSLRKHKRENLLIIAISRRSILNSRPTHTTLFLCKFADLLPRCKRTPSGHQTTCHQSFAHRYRTDNSQLHHQAAAQRYSRSSPSSGEPIWWQPEKNSDIICDVTTNEDLADRQCSSSRFQFRFRIIHTNESANLHRMLFLSLP